MSRDRKVALFLILFAVFVYVNAYLIPKAALQREVGPGAFPIFLSILLVILSIALFFTAGKKKKKEVPQGADQVQSDSQKIKESSAQRLRRIVKALVLLAVYFALMPYLGFLIDTVLFGIVYLIFLYGYKPIRSLAPAIIMAIAGYLIFEVALKIPLPAFMEAIR